MGSTDAHLMALLVFSLNFHSMQKLSNTEGLSFRLLNYQQKLFWNYILNTMLFVSDEEISYIKNLWINDF